MRINYIRIENLDAFSAIASLAFKEEGRGAIVVDVTSQPLPGAGHPFAYFDQETIEQQDDRDVTRIVAEYDPAQEFVVVLLKPQDRTSTYRVGIVTSGHQASAAPEDVPENTDEPAAESELEPPDVETLIAWEAQGGCEAACPHHCWVEPKWGDLRTGNRTRISTDTHGFLMIFGQIREDLCESASKIFVGVSETGILKLPPDGRARNSVPHLRRFPNEDAAVLRNCQRITSRSGVQRQTILSLTSESSSAGLSESRILRRKASCPERTVRRRVA